MCKKERGYLIISGQGSLGHPKNRIPIADHTLVFWLVVYIYIHIYMCLGSRLVVLGFSFSCDWVLVLSESKGSRLGCT